MSGIDKENTDLQSSQENGTNAESIPTKLTTFLLRWGVETNGITPVPTEDRTDKRLYQMFFVWFSANFNILAFSTGSAGPAFFGLGIRDSLVIILAMDIISCIIPAYFGVFGPKLGARGMVQSRFAWGYYGSIIPSVLNVFSMQGFLILNCIVGGQTLASVSTKLDATLGIVIISALSLVVTFCGYKMMHWYESLAWIPNAISFIIMLGVGGKHLRTYPTVPAPSAAQVISFATFLISSVISWCTMTPDYGVYHNAKASSLRIFFYTYLGFLLSSMSIHMLGAAFAAAAPGVSSYQDGFENGSNVGGLIGAIFAPTRVISLSIPSACAPTMYTFVPRYVFPIISEAILIPVAIVGAKRFYGTLVNVLRDFYLYNLVEWDQPRLLPLGLAAALAFFGAFGIIIPSMSQVWYSGPIAEAGAGDIGVLTGFLVAMGLYLVLRTVERKFSR
ncbi:purine-cytosine permease [Infundibulicybe gibba]|nr:purine-cytosine permease [Infundibulicybe gibba]